MIKQGTLPLVQQDKAIAAIQAGGKTVDELTGIYFSKNNHLFNNNKFIRINLFFHFRFL